MLRPFFALVTATCVLVVLALSPRQSLAQQPEIIGTRSQKPQGEASGEKSAGQENEDKKNKQEKRARRASRKGQKAEASTDNGAQTNSEDDVVISADRQSKEGDLYVYEGYVDAVQNEYRLQADRVTLNNATQDMVAEGNVIFDQGPDQRVTAKRAELNWQSHKGRFWETTGFTNRTQTGEFIFYTASRVDKIGEDTYEMFDAVVTACEDVIPKWTFRAKHAQLKMGDRVTMRNAIFRIKALPAFAMPYIWVPATRNERKSGFLLPTSGSSNQKGRTLKAAYYQTLGDSADITFRGDIYSQRGLGFGAEFRAQTGEKSYLRLGLFTVKDRLFGPPGENDGGTAVVGEGVQYLPHGWLAVGNLSLVTSLQFRQIFSDDISQVIDPRRESQFYANNNANGISVNFLASNETTTLFRPSNNPGQPTSGTEVDVAIRQAPELDLDLYPRRVFKDLPIYLSVESSVGALKRLETVNQAITLVTPAAVQRFDIEPKVTVPLATFAGIAITPSIAFRETLYSSSVDPQVPLFDPTRFTTNPTDPRLDPTNPQFTPGLAFYDRNVFDPIVSKMVSRRYSEFAVDVRPPGLEKTYENQDDGSARFRHLIEPYITYRRIDGIGSTFGKIILFDDNDAVANTNEFEYAVVNRFFVLRSNTDLVKRRKRTRLGGSTEIRPVKPQPGDKKQPEARDNWSQASAQEKPSEQPKETNPEQGGQKKQTLEQGEKADLKTRIDQRTGRDQRREGDQSQQTNGTTLATNVEEPDQPHELLTIKVAQKYFFDREFGGALVEGSRNQFFPLNALSGFTAGGVKRAFSPVNIAVRYRPLSSVFADLRMDVGTSGEGVRDLTVGGGLRTDKVTLATSYYLSRRIELQPNQFEAGTFPGNQILTTVQLGDDLRGMYGGTRIGYDFTDRFIDVLVGVSKGRLRSSRSYVGYSWDCCGIQFNYSTFKAGLRNESAFSFTFNLAGLGSFGSDQFSQLGGGRGGRRRGRRNQTDDLP